MCSQKDAHAEWKTAKIKDKMKKIHLNWPTWSQQQHHVDLCSTDANKTLEKLHIQTISRLKAPDTMPQLHSNTYT